MRTLAARARLARDLSLQSRAQCHKPTKLCGSTRCRCSSSPPRTSGRPLCSGRRSGRRGGSIALDIATSWSFRLSASSRVRTGRLLVEREPLAGGVWLTSRSRSPAVLPVALLRRREPRDFRRRAPGRSELESSRSGGRCGEQRLGRTDDPGAVARAVLERVEEIVGVELASPRARRRATADGLGLWSAGVERRELDWISRSAHRSRATSRRASRRRSSRPLRSRSTTRRASKIVSRRLVEATGAKSVAFVPLIANERVIAVLVVGTTSEHRAFTTEELALLQTLAAEAGARARPDAHRRLRSRRPSSASVSSRASRRAFAPSSTSTSCSASRCARPGRRSESIVA